MEWSLKIQKVGNGFILENNEEGDKSVVVFEKREDSPDYLVSKDEDLGSLRNMLYYIVEYFGYYPSRKDSKRLVIGVER